MILFFSFFKFCYGSQKIATSSVPVISGDMNFSKWEMIEQNSIIKITQQSFKYSSIISKESEFSEKMKLFINLLPRKYAHWVHECWSETFENFSCKMTNSYTFFHKIQAPLTFIIMLICMSLRHCLVFSVSSQ